MLTTASFKFVVRKCAAWKGKTHQSLFGSRHSSKALRMYMCRGLGANRLLQQATL